MAGSSFRKAVAGALEDLTEKDFEKFCFHLLDRRDVRRNRVEGKNYMEIADMLVNHLTEEGAILVTVDLLNQIGCCDIAKRLGEETAGLSSTAAEQCESCVSQQGPSGSLELEDCGSVLDCVLQPDSAVWTKVEPEVSRTDEEAPTYRQAVSGRVRSSGRCRRCADDQLDSRGVSGASPVRLRCVSDFSSDSALNVLLVLFTSIKNMEPPDFEALNFTAEPAPPGYRLCAQWRDGAEGSVFHLAHIFLFLGFMGGSGFYGLLYLFTFLTLGFFCCTLWAWSDSCTTDSFLWSFALFGVCLGQVLHVSYRLRSVSFDKDYQDLYNCMFKKLGVSLLHFGKIVASSEGDVHTLETDHCFAIEGKTAIDKLSVLLSGRIRVTVNGEFLHYIYPFQFLDSPEWDSLRPSEEGVFQVTLRADNPCRYVAWRRKKLYLLFAKHRYIAKIFALVVRNDIAEKLYSLNDKAVGSSGRRYDLRLPSYCHMPGTELEKTAELLQVPLQGGRAA